MRRFLKLIGAVICFVFLSACQPQEKDETIKVGVILPMEHKALQEIVEGFRSTLEELHKTPVKIIVKNAQGDMNLQRAITQQMRDQRYDLIVPVATSPSQMAISMIHNKPIVSLAATISHENRPANMPCNYTGVRDEIPPGELIKFLHAAYPQLKKLVIIHSSSDKVFPEVKDAEEAGTKLGITVKPLMILSLPELVSTLQAMPSDTQGIFILKDNLIASGIATLVKEANRRHILLFTSDQGTVQSGAGFALGVHERDIGVEGAKLAAEILSGKAACDLPIVDMKKFVVFVNKDAMQKEQQNPQSVINAANKLGFKVENI